VGIFHFYSAPVGTPGNAVLNWTAEPVTDILAYARSYREAAFRLVQVQEKREYGEVDHAACPIIFLYRHSLELYLKAMIYRAARVSVSDSELLEVLPRLWREHSLRRLFDMAEPVIELLARHLLPVLGGVREDVMDLVGELDEVDPGSYAFRYPVTGAGAPSLPQTVLVNVFKFAQRAEDATVYLSDMCGYLGRAIPPSSQLRIALSPIVKGGAGAP
jgi:hypothetical protein